MDLAAWSKVASGNTSAPPDGAPEGWFPNQPNDTIRELMAQVRSWYDEPDFLNLTYGASLQRDSDTQITLLAADYTNVFTTGRRIRILGSSPAVAEGFVASSSFSTNTVVQVEMDGGVVPTSPTKALVGFGSLSRAAYPSGGAIYVGQVEPFFGAVAAIPSWALLCDGAAVSRTTYADLHAFLKDAAGANSYPYGSGDGSTTFNVPNLKKRVLVGYDSADADYDAPGDTGGAEEVTLDVTQLPSHNHGGATGAAPPEPGSWAFYSARNTGGGGAQVDIIAPGDAYLTAETSQHSHTIPSQGGGQAHENRPPFMAVPFIIRWRL